MANPENGLQPVSPATVLGEIAAAVPADCRGNIIVIGSLAVAYHYRDRLRRMAVRTKDADCLLSPRVKAIPSGVAIADQLLDADWTFKGTPGHPAPGTKRTPIKDLPAVRLQPPNQSEWFIELLTVPSSSEDRTLRWTRLETKHGHFALPSFGFLSLANLDPLPTDMGIFIARPEMMALANLLEHPEISSETMTGGFGGRPEIKRSNKDLGRVLAIARLAIARDEDVLQSWPALWKTALQTRFRKEWRTLAGRVGQGLRTLLANEPGLEQAHFTCNNGLLAGMPPTLQQLKIVGQRLLQDAIVPVETEARQSE